MPGFGNEAVDREFFPDGHVKSNFICALGHGEETMDATREGYRDYPQPERQCRRAFLAEIATRVCIRGRWHRIALLRCDAEPTDNLAPSLIVAAYHLSECLRRGAHYI